MDPDVCSNCSAVLKGRQTYCGHCGSKIVREDTISPSQPILYNNLQRLIKLLTDRLMQEQGVDLCNDEFAMNRIIESAKIAEAHLMFFETTDINLPYLAVRDGKAIHLITRVQRTDLCGTNK